MTRFWFDAVLASISRLARLRHQEFAARSMPNVVPVVGAVRMNDCTPGIALASCVPSRQNISCSDRNEPSYRSSILSSRMLFSWISSASLTGLAEKLSPSVTTMPFFLSSE